MKEDEMGGAFEVHVGKKSNVTVFWWRNLKGTDDLEFLGLDGRIILK
jgi:hypothetical protein